MCLKEAALDTPDPIDSGTIDRSDIGRRTQIAAGIAAAVLLLGFLTVYGLKTYDAHRLAAETASAASTAAPVDVATAAPAAGTSRLTLPGETAPWYGATIYARVDGYVGKWLVDIGDHVEEGQVLATIETPELDAELQAARAQLKASEAQVVARRAEAEFSKSANERWRDSP